VDAAKVELRSVQREEYDSMKMKYEQKNKELMGLQKKFERQQAALANLTAVHAQDKQNNGPAIVKLQRELAACRQSATEKEKEYQNEINKLRDLKKTLCEMHNNVSKELVDAEKKNKDISRLLNSERATQKRMVRSLELIKHTQQMQLVEAESKNTELEGVVQEMTRTGERREAKLIEAQGKCAELEGAVQEMTRTGELREAKLVEAQGKCAELESVVQEMTHNIETVVCDMTRTATHQGEKLINAQRKCAELEVMMEDMTRIGALRETELAKAQSEHANLQGEVQKMVCIAVERETELADAQVKCADLEYKVLRMESARRSKEGRSTSAPQTTARLAQKRRLSTSVSGSGSRRSSQNKRGRRMEPVSVGSETETDVSESGSEGGNVMRHDQNTLNELVSAPSDI